MIPHSRYVLVRKVAEGGSAAVHLAWDTEALEYRAIKILQAEHARRAALRNRFEREGQTMASLNHPNIIKVFEAAAHADTAYLVMEFAEGGSVIDWIERHGRPMPPQMATTIALELCAGIIHAHDRGVIHRDIKPHNLLLDRHGRCKVTDFGIAQATADPRMTMTGTVMGTVGYMAPEQHESAKHADERADVYSVASTLYTLVAGEAQQHLFMAEDRDFTRIPPQLAEVIRRGAQFRREMRYQTVREMASALRLAMERLPPDSANTPPLIPRDLVLLDHEPPPPASGLRPKGPDLVGMDSVDSVEPPMIDRRIRTDSDGRTPSSIIPRTSLTSHLREKSRRPRIQSREERIRQDQLRWAIRAMVALGVFTGFALLIIALYGGFNISRANAGLDVAEDALLSSVLKESGLPGRLDEVPQVDAAKMKELFDRILEEEDRGVREGDVERLLALMDRSLDDLAGQGPEFATKSLQSAHKNIEKLNEAFQERQEELDSAQGGLSGRLACTIRLARCE